MESIVLGDEKTHPQNEQTDQRMMTRTWKKKRKTQTLNHWYTEKLEHL